MQTSATDLCSEIHLDSFLYSATTFSHLYVVHCNTASRTMLQIQLQCHLLVTFPTALLQTQTCSVQINKHVLFLHTEWWMFTKTSQPWTRSWLVHQINALAIHLHLWVPMESHQKNTGGAMYAAPSTAQISLSAMIHPVVGGQPIQQREDRPGVTSLRVNWKMIRDSCSQWQKTGNILQRADILALACLQSWVRPQRSKGDQERENEKIKVEGERIPQWIATPVLGLYFKACFRLDMPGALKWITGENRKLISSQGPLDKSWLPLV